MLGFRRSMGRLHLLILPVMLPVLSLAGCSVGFWQARPVPFVSEGSALMLERPLTFTAGTTRTYFQHGRPVTERELTVWEHHCALALDHALEADISIPAGRYSVAYTQRRSTVGEWGYGVITYESTFDLAADARPLFALYCEIWTTGDGYDYRQHLTPDELAEVLGEWLRLESAR